METQKQRQSWLGGAGPGAIGLRLGSLWGSEPDEAETKTGCGARSPGRAEYAGRGVELPLCLAAGAV